MKFLGAWAVDRPWIIISVAVIVTIGLGLFIPQIELVTNFEKYLSPSNPAVKAMNDAEERYGSQAFLRVTVESEGAVLDIDALRRIEQLREDISDLDGVKAVEGPLNSEIIIGKEDSLSVEQVAPEGRAPENDEKLEEFKARLLGNDLLVGRVISSSGSAAALSIELEKDVNEEEVANRIRTITDDYQGPEEIYIAGLPFMNSVLSESIMEDLITLLPLVFVAITLVLYLSFRSPRGVLLPLLVVALSATWTIGLLALLKVPFTLISFILPVILVAVGTAYSIHVLNKYYELSALDMGKREVIQKATAAMFSPVSMAGMTTAAGFLALISSFLIPQRQFGIFAAVGVFISVALSLSLLPAILSLLPLDQKSSGEKNSQGLGSRLAHARESFLVSFEKLVSQRKKTVLLAFLVVLAVFSVGTFTVTIETSQESFLGEDNPVTKGMNSLDQNFSGSQQLLVEVDTGRDDGLQDPEVLKEMEEFEEWLKTKDGVQVNNTFSLATIVKQLNQKFHGDDPDLYRTPEDGKLVSQLLWLFSFQGGGLGRLALSDYSAGEITALYNSVPSSETVKFESDVRAYLEENFDSAETEIVGSTRLAAMISSKVVSSQLISLITSIGVAGLIVALITGSLAAGVISLIPLILTVLINFGVMGYSGTPLNLATLMVSSIVIGIGIDYAIHFIERFRLEYSEEKDEREILSKTLRTTGRGIFYNALALAAGFAILAFSTFQAIVNFGFLMALTMIISMISAFTVIPAVLLIFRPSFLDKGSE
ncbi:MAG: efflux RND transporter permease subunit [Candidatus Bipolaricaulota bacterium]